MPEKKVNILFVEYCKDLKGGGAQRVYLDILKHMNKTLYNIYAALPVYQGGDLKNEIPEYIEILNYDSKSPSDSGNGFKAYLKFGFNVPLVLFRCYFLIVRHKIEVVYVHSTISGLHFALLKKIKNFKLIYHEHNMVTQRPDGMLWRMLFRFVTHNSDAVVAISHGVAASLLEAGVDKCKLEMIHNGVENIANIDIKKLEEEGCQRLGLIPDNFVVGMVGHFREWKGQMLFVEMANKICKNRSDIIFVIVGGVHDKRYYQQVIKYIEEHKLSDNVIITGHQNKVDELIACMDVVVVPSVPEPFGLVVLEAMRLEKPVIAFNVGGPSEIIADNQTGVLVDEVDSESLASAITELVQDNERLKRMGKNGRASFLDDYTLEVQSNKISQLVTRLML